MKAVCWCGTGKVKVEEVPMPRIMNPRDAIVKTTLSTICGSDLHLYGGFVPSMQKGDILGHEMVGEVVETGKEVRNIAVGDRVVVAFSIACGRCWYCQNQEFSLCDNSNPNAAMMEKIYNFSTAGIFGYSHLFGGYAGAQAEYIRVPFADVGAFKIPDGMSDEQALPCADIFATGFMGAELCDIKQGDVVAVWGCGPVGQFVIKSAFLLGAEQVIAIDNVPERLHLAAQQSGATPLNHSRADLYDALKTLTGGRGPDACIDAVGMEAHGYGWLMSAYDRIKTALYLQGERAHVLRAMIQACRKGGTLSIMGVYGLAIDKFPLGVAFAKGLRFKMGQCHVHRYIPRLFDYWQTGKVDPSFVFSHHLPLSQAAEAYRIFRDKRQRCIKVALRPAAAQPPVQQVACEAVPATVGI
jgi:threonine dehydrogenase-like Zn-dependent dehydrogenase